MLADGRTIDSEDVLGPPGGRKKLVIVGDTETIEDLADHVRDADVLVIEATFLNRDAAIARDYGHLTAAEAATLAALSNVKILVLTHISGRYPDEEILAEATKIFPNSREAMNEDVERFLEECRADAFFQNNPNAVDRIEDLLTKFYHEADESPAWQEVWDRIRGIITGKAPLIERFEELLLFLKKAFG
jgi:hypothetical protein